MIKGFGNTLFFLQLISVGLLIPKIPCTSFGDKNSSDFFIILYFVNVSNTDFLNFVKQLTNLSNIELYYQTLQM